MKTTHKCYWYFFFGMALISVIVAMFCGILLKDFQISHLTIYLITIGFGGLFLMGVIYLNNERIRFKQIFLYLGFYLLIFTFIFYGIFYPAIKSVG
jgi:hypothetical protein